MKKNPLKALGSCFVGVTLAASMVPMAAGTAVADPAQAYWVAPDAAVTVDTSSILKTYGVRAGSAGPDFVGITNTNYDFNGGKASQTDQYAYSSEDFQGVKGAGLAIWATSVNENVNPFYANLMYSGLSGDSNVTKATSWMSNPETSSWGDSNGSASTKASDGSATIAGLEYSPEIIFGAEKMTNWGNFSSADTNIGKEVAAGTAAGSDYNPTFTNNDSTNLWTQIYTINQLALKAEEVKGASENNLTTRYDNNDALEGALSYEKALRGNLLYIASQIDEGAVEKKTVAYLYAIDENNTGYFFIPEASGLLKGDDTGQTKTSDVSTPDDNYAANNGTIDLDYMDTLPFITDTFKGGTPVEGGIVMKCEDIYKSNPAVSVQGNASDAPLAGVDVIIYNSTKNTDLQGKSGGKNESGINNAEALTDDIVTKWAQSVGFDGDTILAGDDYGTSTNQGFGTKDATANGMSPMLYCQRNYTTDKPARAVWAFSQVYPTLYKSADDSYSYWVDNVYHVNTTDVAKVVKYMTNQSDDVVYDVDTYEFLEQCYNYGLTWWQNKGQYDTDWNQYAYYTGSSRASYYSGNTASEEPANTIGIFAPTALWASNVKTTTRVAGEEAYQTAVLVSQETFQPGQCDTVIIANDRDFMDSMSATGLAGALHAPILLVNPDGTLYNEVKAEIERLGATKAYIIGGQNAISYDLEDALGISSERIYGTEAPDTSVACANKITEVTDGVSNAIIARSDNFQDALSMSSYAYAYGAAIILAPSEEGSAASSLPEGGVDFVNSTTGYLYIAGGEGAIAKSVTEGIEKAEDQVIRLGGEDGYDTSNQVAYYMQQKNLLDGDTAVIANGSLAAKGLDALAGAALAGQSGGVILLANGPDDAHAAALGDTDLTTILGEDSEGLASYLHHFVAETDDVYVLGGTAVFSQDFFDIVNGVMGICE